jgi:iron(III) transport system permease protein
MLSSLHISSVISRLRSPWINITLILTLVISIPIVVVLSYLFLAPTATWFHIVETLLLKYTLNTLILLVGTGLFTLFFGVFTAWITSMYRFPGHKFFGWGLILPLSLPAYIAAYTYAGMLDYTSPLYTFFRNSLGIETGQFLFFNIMSIGGVIFILSMVLYPYIFLITRTFFLQQSSRLLEASASLGYSPSQTFRKVALPMARPAIVAGLALVFMEVLNEYGAVKYYGVETFTIGIFQAWFSFGDAGSAMKLSAILMIFVLLLLSIERLQRGRSRFEMMNNSFSPPKKYRLKGVKAALAVILCLIPFLLGFLIPVFQLAWWSILTAGKIIDLSFINLVGNSFLLALSASAIVVVLSLFIAYTIRIFNTGAMRSIGKIATLGYSIPGAVIAVGIMIPFAFADGKLNEWLGAWFGFTPGLILSGTILAVVFGYTVRFFAVGFNTVESGFERISRNLDEASRSLGKSSFSTLFSVNLPLLKGALLSAAILVFIDVLKELPLTLILRPFNFDTLAINAFQYASDERIAESSSAALIIIATGILPVFLLNKMLIKDK